MASEIDRGLARPWHALRLPGELEGLYRTETEPRSGLFVQSWLLVFTAFNLLSLKADLDAFGAERFWIPMVATLGVVVPSTLLAILACRGRPSRRRQTAAVTLAALVDMAVTLNSAGQAPAEHANTYLVLAAIIPLVVGMIAPLSFRHSLWFCVSACTVYLVGVALLGYVGVGTNGIPLLVASLTLVPIKLNYSREWEAKRGFLLSLRERAQAVELSRANERLAHLSETDPLAGTANRRLFDLRLAEIWKAAGPGPSVILFDIDHFKLLNDTAGHAEGDRCIRQVADALAAAVGSVGLLARYGGEEFAALIPGTDTRSAGAVAEKARALVEGLGIAHPGLAEGGVLTVSAGIAVRDRVVDAEPAFLVKRADDALYAAKRAGRNRVRGHAPSPGARSVGFAA
ncbi:hypothetical protein BHAOGJBA_1342 [Methylobacterium hispanicum]|uniref:diguanylate cyclase n=1 Tax=Methylobacterium hispanicum TaxID=270350 RepID=A0AAV4ZI14_9HYPH|nr:diguanylate cyclase [Methylobacterium hispanicum]GJD87837.1 hypothetical protein BHAOGJBA_1342 [Methylobacterium hispanicum]